ncbi:MAG: putative integral rane protein [Frankiales bacterium]|nr:putative integral rane protein [Frankiales bacterium]
MTMPELRLITWPQIRRPERAAGVLALALGLLHLALFPGSGMDLSAQLARASFAAQAPFTPVDLSWYSGIHPYGYSLVAPWLMSGFGVATCGLLAATISAVLFARLVRYTDRPWMAGLSGAFFWAANVASGRVTFALGAVTALAALVALPKLRLAAVLAVLTGLLSPVAAAFLGFVAAVLVLHRKPGGWTLGITTTVPVVVLAVAFPGGGIQPLSPGAAIPGILVGLALGIFTAHPLVRTAAFLYAAMVVVLAVASDPFGSNILRLGLLLAISLLLATTAGRTRVVMVVLSCGFLVWQLFPLIGDLRSTTQPLTPLTQALERADAQRVEVLAGRDHHEAYEVARSVPIARGWSRQIDVRDNPLFYRNEPLGAGEYVAWLRDNAVDYVAAPRTGKLDHGSVLEGALLEGPVPGLKPQWQDDNWIVYRVLEARPIVAAPAHMVSSNRIEMVLESDRAAPVAVDVRWSRWLSLAGPGCLQRSGDRVLIRFQSAGTVTMTSSLNPAGRCETVKPAA